MDTTLSKNAYGEAITKATTIADAQPAYDIVVGRMEKNLSGDKGWKVGNNLRSWRNMRSISLHSVVQFLRN